MSSKTTVKQFMTGGLDTNFSYLATCANDAFIVDPCGNTGLITHAAAKHPGLNVRYILLTHGHHDHVEGVPAMLQAFPAAKTVAHPACSYPHDISLGDREHLEFGNGFIECLHSPGHSDDSVIYRLSDDSAIFTGDTLFIDCCGYCNARKMFATMRNVIYPLTGSNIVYSGHNYGHVPYQALQFEKENNPYLNVQTFEEFHEALKLL